MCVKQLPREHNNFSLLLHCYGATAAEIPRHCAVSRWFHCSHPHTFLRSLGNPNYYQIPEHEGRQGADGANSQCWAL